MLHLVVLAMITAWDFDNDATTTHASQLTQRLAGAGMAGSAVGTDDTTDQPLVRVCTYGAPQLGPHLLSEAPDVMRTMTTPQCSDGASELDSAMGFEPMLASQVLLVDPRRVSKSGTAPVALTEESSASDRRAVISAPTSLSGPVKIELRMPERSTSMSGSARSAGAKTTVVHRAH